MTPAVSVIIAARDYGHYLAEALRSVQRQTFSEWELILVDDGSRDDTPHAVRPFLADGRIRYIRSDALGQTRAKNLALRLSHAAFVAPLDGDDVWLPTKLERQVRLMRANPKIGVSFCRRFLIGPEGDISPSNHADWPRGDVFNDVLLDNFVCFSSTMIRRDVLEHVGAFDNRLELAIDYDLWLRVARHYPFDFIDEGLVKYRTGHGNLSKRLSDRITTVLSIMRRCLQRRGNAAILSEKTQKEAWGSTCRTMGFWLRDKVPIEAGAWYLKASRHDRKWGITARSLARCTLNWIARKRAERM